MGSFRFRRSKNLGPLRVNLTKTGVGISTGVPGARLSVHSSGRVTKTLGVPRTGLYYRDDSFVPGSTAASQSGPAAARAAAGGQPAGWYADPVKHAELRYWSGQEWTTWVSTHGTLSQDTLGEALPNTDNLNTWWGRSGNPQELLDMLTHGSLALYDVDPGHVYTACARQAEQIRSFLQAERATAGPDDPRISAQLKILRDALEAEMGILDGIVETHAPWPSVEWHSASVMTMEAVADLVSRLGELTQPPDQAPIQTRPIGYARRMLDWYRRSGWTSPGPLDDAEVAKDRFIEAATAGDENGFKQATMALASALQRLLDGAHASGETPAEVAGEIETMLDLLEAQIAAIWTMAGADDDGVMSSAIEEYVRADLAAGAIARSIGGLPAR
jgi:predicted HAD superfamily Cof-like phosphohydrolase